MYGFGAESEQGEPQGQEGAVAPKFYRDYMDKVSQQLKALQDRNDALESSQRQQEVRTTLTAKGYAPQVADLYTGEPGKLDDWLGTYGAGLAKADGAAAGEAGQGAQGAPQSVIPAESQAAMAAFSAAGTDGAIALTGEEALVARMNAASSKEEFDAIMRDAGNRRF
jgi:hypothetical protein